MKEWIMGEWLYEQVCSVQMVGSEAVCDLVVLDWNKYASLFFILLPRTGLCTQQVLKEFFMVPQEAHKYKVKD